MTALENHIAIFGAGLSGRAAYKRACDLGMNIVIDDDHQITHEDIKKEDICAFAQWPWANIKYLVLSPGVPLSHPAPHQVVRKAKAHHVEIISEVEFALRTGQWGDVIAITGTNGKSTTTALCGHVLKSAGLSVSIGGNLGDPLSLLEEQPEGITVLELSSYQLECTPSLTPRVAAILNISADHLDRHGGMAGYVDAKKNALRGLPKSGLALVGDTGAEMAEIGQWAAEELPCQTEILASDSLAPCKLDNAYLAGAHNLQNAAFAVRIARQLGLADDVIEAGLNSFGGLPHRLRPVARLGDVLFVNDSKATNGDAASRALGAYEDVIWLAGGLAKDDGITQCLSYLPALKSAHFYGKAAADFCRQAQARTDCYQHDTLDDAFYAATENLTDKAVILFSPAAASFDQYPNFSARGIHFETLVNAYVAQHQQGGSHAR